MLEINGVTKTFKKSIVLKNINLKLNQGVYGLLGPNGAGKTTLLRCIMGLYPVDGGNIIYQCMKENKKEDFLKNIGYLPQTFGAFRELTPRELLHYFSYLKKIEPSNILEQIYWALEIVNLSDKIDEKVKTLSGGMVRRLGIAQALLGSPEVLLFDEPTVGLDPEERIRFKNIISKISEGKIIIISTHIIEDVEALCDDIIVMDKGIVLTVDSILGIKKQAEGKVFSCIKSKIPVDFEDYFIEQEYRKNEELHCRFISKNCNFCNPVEPNVEDGYLCILRKL